MFVHSLRTFNKKAWPETLMRLVRLAVSGVQIDNARNAGFIS